MKNGLFRFNCNGESLGLGEFFYFNRSSMAILSPRSYLR